MSEFRDKTVLVTGASMGIGLQIAKEYAALGAHVIMVARDGKRLETAIESIETGKENVEWVACDLSKHQAVLAMMDGVIRKRTAIDILVNNVGAFSEKTEWNEISEDTWENALRLNLLSAYHCIVSAVKSMTDNGVEGSIVNVGSSAALQLKKGRLHYTVSKSGLHTMSKVLAMDLAKYGIRVNVVAPGPTATETVQARIDDPAQKQQEEIRLKKIPLGRYAKPEDIAEAVIFLSSKKASFITGAIVPVDGGYTLGETV